MNNNQPNNNQQPIITQNIPSNNPQPIIIQNTSNNTSQPVNTQNIPNNNPQPVITQNIPNNNPQPVITQNIPNSNPQPVITQNIPNNNLQPVNTQNIPNNNQQPIITQNIPNNNQQPIITQNIPSNNPQPVIIQNTSNNTSQPIITETTPNNNQESKKESSTIKQKIRKIFIFFIFLGLIVIGISIYLLVDDNKKYNTYTPMAADLMGSEKVTKSGIEYYQGTYKYIIDKKEYFYKPKKLYSTTPDKIIQIKYNKEDPNKLYDEEASKLYFIILFSGIAFSFISTIIAISLSPSKLKEIITVEVIEQVTCVGGRRVYLSNLQIDNNAPISYDQKYYVYFTNDLNKFAIGNKLTFNIYKYSEVFTTENYKQKLARVIYEFKNDDFTLIDSTIQKTN